MNDTNCYSEGLKATVTISELHLKDDAVPFSLFFGGDVTSSAQPTEFLAAKKS